MHQGYDHLFKLLPVGNAGVGKSSLIVRFTDSTFSQSFYSSIGVDFKIKMIGIGNSTVKLQIWDTAGQERFRTITSTYYKGAHGFMLVYDITDRQSFKDIQKWVEDTNKYGSQGFVKLLVGNKKDLQDTRQVKTQQGMALAESLGAQFVETSAKDAVNVDKAFITLSTEILSKITNKGT